MSNALLSTRSPFRSRTFAALHNRDFRRFYLGQGISLIGTWLQGAAVNWIVFERTHSEAMLGFVGAAGLLPGLFFGIFAGVLADRVVPRRLILLMEAGQMILAFALAALIALGMVQIWQLITILILTRVFVTFEMPSRQVFLYDLVGRSDLSNAIALNSGLFNASRVIGPALAGIVYASVGATACFALNGASYIAAMVAVCSIQLHIPRSPQGGKGLGEVLGGFVYIGSDRKVLIIFLLMTAFGIIGMGYDSMIPAYASRVVGTGVRGYSVLLASSGAGATIGALVVARFGRGDRKERLALAGVFIFACSLVASALLPGMVGTSSVLSHARTLTAVLGLFGVGFGAVLFYSASQTIVQNVLPDHLRGRVMAIWLIAFSGSVPLGALWTGQVASRYGVALAMVVSACLCVVLGLVGFAAWFCSKPATVTPLSPEEFSR